MKFNSEGLAERLLTHLCLGPSLRMQDTVAVLDGPRAVAMAMRIHSCRAEYYSP